MKKSIYTSLILLSTASLLVACSSKETTKTSQTPKTSQVSKASSSTKVDSSTVSSSSSTEAPVQTGMNIQAIQNGDYSSIAGTWQNASGDKLVFDQSGLISTDVTMVNPPKEDQGILQGGITYQSSGGGFVLLFVPKNVVIPQSHFHEGKDSTDGTRDRLVGTQVALSKTILNSGTFYKVSDSTEVAPANQTISLTQGQETINYATRILGDLGWKIIEDNYNRAEVNPFSTIQGNDNSIYLVYQNGTITTEDGTVVHQP